MGRVTASLKIKSLGVNDIDADGGANIVEVNPLPGILPDPADNSCLPKAARAAGLDYDALIGAALEAAAARQGVALRSVA